LVHRIMLVSLVQQVWLHRLESIISPFMGTNKWTEIFIKN